MKALLTRFRARLAPERMTASEIVAVLLALAVALLAACGPADDGHKGPTIVLKRSIWFPLGLDDDGAFVRDGSGMVPAVVIDRRAP